MLTVLVTILAVVVIGGILLKLLDTIVVETHTISVRDFPNIAGSDGLDADADTLPAHHTGGAR